MKKIKVDKDSHGTIAINWAVIAILICCTAVFLNNHPYIYIPVIAILLAFAFFVFWFHRIPDRDIPKGDSKMVTSVADGKVVIVDRVYEKEYFKDDRIQVSVYMDFFDVHTNFWPMDGEISYYKYHPGKYLLAFLPKASEKNEHSSTVIRNEHGEILFRQIAGTFARRIVCYSKEGDKVERGKQCGIIKFGSRIDIFLPLDADVKVKEGEFTRACETVIAELK
ncbi:MAG TPA: phosphatidylserine decarboxylase family protein [Rikenellaceae bacterium]|nr:phosphatidylserine decarboxylase family protein [Rikenellaceae bacterium]